ncbi:MAG: hypothetical protein WC117_00795 [Sphaerochaetaceae bacterium]
MKKIVVALLAVLAIVSPVFSAVSSSYEGNQLEESERLPVLSDDFTSNSLSIDVSGYMPASSAFYLKPTVDLTSDLSHSQGKQVPIASYSFTTNTVKGTTLTVGPSAGDSFNISNPDGQSYSFEVAICGYDHTGNVSAVSQTSGSNTVSINSGAGSAASYGEVFACFPFYDDALSQMFIAAMTPGEGESNANGLTSELYFDLVII